MKFTGGVTGWTFISLSRMGNEHAHRVVHAHSLLRSIRAQIYRNFGRERKFVQLFQHLVSVLINWRTFQVIFILLSVRDINMQFGWLCWRYSIPLTVLVFVQFLAKCLVSLCILQNLLHTKKMKTFNDEMACNGSKLNGGVYTVQPNTITPTN